MFCGLLFGLLLFLWGLSQIIGTLFHLHIPIFGIIFGLFLLYLGIQVIAGFQYWPKGCCSTDTQDRHYTCTGSSHILVDNTILESKRSPLDYNTIMGKSIIDLSQLTPEAIRATGDRLIVHVNTVFGKTILQLNKNIPIRVVAKGGFAKVTTPDNNTIVFGTHTFNNHVEEEPIMIIHTSTAFGKTKITFQ